MIREQFIISLKNPVIANHKINSQGFMPGLAYIDLIYQIFRANEFNYNELELRNLTIYNPLVITGEEQIILNVICSETTKGNWAVSLEGEDKKQYLTAEVVQIQPIVFEESLDLSSLKKEALPLDEIYQKCRQQNLIHTDLMKSDGYIYRTNEGILIELSVPQQALSSAEEFMFHPALFDGSGIGANVLLAPFFKDQQSLYLPLFYESFYANELLSNKVFAHIKSSSIHAAKELIYLTIEYFNSSGQKVAHLKNFSIKSFKVNSKKKDIEQFLSNLVAESLKRPVEQISPKQGYYEMGLDSPALLGMVKAIGSKLGMNLSPTLLFEYTTISDLADYLSENHSAPLTQLNADVSKSDGDIAIIGMKGRYPKAKDLEEFWQNLVEGRDCISEIPPSRWDWRSLDGIHSPSGKAISKWGGFIEDPDCFDPLFFRISPKEAETMDPQERLFLEVCWEAIEDAGYTPITLSQKNQVGVFVGVMHKDYALLGAENLSKENIFTLSLNYAPIANRVSYFCNFHGPSLAVDTVCSSSLTAVHLALESLRHGECEVALAGGVNLSLHPDKYITYGSGDMFSSDGYCHSFGKGGDGYVSAEGVGAVLLKPLSQAVEDGDQIYAVIKGSSINHVGAVSGITVPSPTAQAELIEKCIEKTGIDPRTISYVEAHGTGTSLGDPIEIQGLVKAFGKYTQEKQFCAIGSIKSNMGHAEAAAGISGLTKVALQLHHQTLVPSLHSEELNPYLDLPNTPFYVQHKTETWKGPFPLRAGISSFGATGSNAHLILEEYRPKNRGNIDLKEVIVPLSAKSKERLVAYAEKLLAFLHKDIDLFDLAYTLQVGREAMEERVAFIAHDIGELIEQLKGFVANRTEKQKQGSIAQQWVKSGSIEWNSLWGKIKPRRMHVPTYPFAKERYWIPKGNQKKNNDFLHPLLHQNTSDFTKQEFTSIFTGKEFFFEDHVINNKKILPAVAYLEMVRAGVEKTIKEKKTVTFKDVVWVKPMIIDDRPITVHLGLYSKEESEIAFEIYGEDEGLFSQGRIELTQLLEVPRVNLKELQESCRGFITSKKQCYQAFKSFGIDYGIGFQGIEKLYIGQNQLLAKIALPSSVSSLEPFVLHPCVLDPAIHASIGFILSSQEQTLSLPFALEELVIFQSCCPSMWSFIQYREDPQAGFREIDVDLFDEEGNLCVRIKGLSSRELEHTPAIGTLFLEPVWVEQKEIPLEFKEKRVIQCTSDEDFISQGFKVFDEIQTLLKNKLTSDYLVQVVVPNPKDGRCLRALLGLLKTAHLENPYFHGQLIEEEKWTALEWKELKIPQSLDIKPWKDDGVYLITGGLGGLGWIFAKEIATHTNKATLILTGRSFLNEKGKAQLQELQQLGITAIYSQTDVTDAEGVRALIQQYPQLNGIIHCAGVLQDNFIIKKSKEEVERVLAPKVLGTINLDEATKEISLDFFILFSSVAGAVGNVGQADYATGNAFMNSYAEYRSTRRKGKTLSILWPLWKEGGMRVDAEIEKRMRENSGMIPMSTEAGLRAFYQAFSSGKSQVLVIEGDLKQLSRFFEEEEASLNKNDFSQVLLDDFPEKAEVYFKQVLSTVLKLPQERIDASAPLEKYGIDSVLIVQMTNQLEKVFGPLSKTLFFEYQNIRDLTRYFCKVHYQKLIEHLGLAPSEPIKYASKVREVPRSIEEKKSSDDIAIIGMSGRYPQADNLIEFWKNLTEGKDCISEIPKERWNHSLYFDEDKNKPGKTYSKWGGFLNDVDAFDPLFFHISPKDAELIDPQERLFLQCVYETLEDAGYTKDNIQPEGKVAVYVGVMYEEYQLFGAQEQEKGRMISLGGNPSSIANRVSYFFNFHGMSVALDTMCSSSLTALHLACENLKKGGCELAIAGGVNLSIHPNKYLMLGQGKFVSSKGRCESFGIGGDGYVPGEGVGAVLLKPLAKAIADGDHIYGIVKGTAVNHGGKTNGYSVPNPRAQSDVIKMALREAKVNPRAISYIEAHGTGTSLGDPIEVTGLAKAFEEYTDDTQFCALGSAKSNIGHCESAAGIAGLTKVLLQMKYQKLVPSLHSNELNPNIDFTNSPFVVQQELEEWKRPVLKTKEYPRIAGLSGFGAGGSNAHVIIEEYIPKEQGKRALNGSVIIVLSAESEEQLKVQAKRLLEGIGDQDLLDIAFTLQVGREAMTERLALIVNTIGELQEKLSAFIGGNETGIFRGKRNKEILTAFDEDMNKTIEAWIGKRKYAKILDLWVKGTPIDWNKLYGDERPKRVSLPTYPFAKERYWITKSQVQAKSSSTLHPLLHENTSDLTEQRFTSIFTGEEFFFSDHIVKGTKILPGVAHLEMARAALEKGLRENQGVKLTDIFWVTPIAMETNQLEIHIGLYAENNGEISYEIYGQQLYSQGRAKLFPIKEPPTVNLEELKRKCNQQTFTREQCYLAFQKMGIEYGSSFRGIEILYLSKNQILSKISFPKNNAADFLLHPSIMDAAFHSSIGFSMNAEESQPLSLPFAMEELEIYSPLSSTMWSYVQAREQGNSKIAKYDIDLCDETGKVCVRMKGACIKAVEESPKTDSSSHKMLIPTWEPMWEIELEAILPEQRVLIIGGTQEEHKLVVQSLPKVQLLGILPQRFEEQLISGDSIDHLVWIATFNSFDGDELIAEQNNLVIQALRMIKKMFQLGYETKKLSLTFITTQAQAVLKNEDIDPSQSGLYGLLGTLAKEVPHWEIRLIDLEQGAIWPADQMFALPLNRYRHPWAYRNKGWYRQQLVPLQNAKVGNLPYRKEGVYVVLGGAGYIGEAWSEYMMRNYQAQIIWIGRRPLNSAIQSKLDRLAAIGPAPQYYSANAADRQDLERVYQQIKKDHLQIHGLIHSAMIFREQSLQEIELEDFGVELTAKVDVSVRMIQVFQKEPLDFILFFSSLVSHIKNIKQASYASGSTFADAFAHQLAQRFPVKVMNWGYWGSDQTAQEDQFVEELDRIGLGLIDPKEGMKALEILLLAPFNQMAVIRTTKPIAIEGMNQQGILSAIPQKYLINMHREPPKKLEVKLNKKIDELLCKLLYVQLQTVNPSNLQKFYGRWFSESMKIVQDLHKTDCEDAWKKWEQQKAIWLKDENTKAMVALVDTTLRALPDILKAKVAATDILFPNSSMALVEGVYKNNQVSDYFNEVLADSIISYVQEKLKVEPNEKIKIFEIGAGTGGTSATVLRKLRPYQKQIEEYCYTDLSRAFLLHAEKEYGPENPYLTYKTFNVEEPLTGIELGSYDIVIAANVLHATKNIRRTLRNTKALLKNQGALFLNELAEHSLFAHLTFGLLEGWWLYEDPEWRIPGSPGLTPESWKKVLENEGFMSTTFLAPKAHSFGQQCIVAFSDGVILQKQPALQQKIPPAATKEVKVQGNLFKEKSTTYFIKLIGETLKIPLQKIDPSEPLEKYGIDSIVVVQLTNKLREFFENVTSTLFFEYQTIDAIVDYFLKTQTEALAKLVNLENHQNDQPKIENEAPQISMRKSRRYREPAMPAKEEEIAIIGLSGRYAKSKTVEELWKNLREGKNCITEIPKNRFDWQQYFNEQKGKIGSIYTKWGGFIEDYDTFDPSFFQISPLDAEGMDPQERCFLEAAYSSIEDAGYTPSTLSSSRKIGVFVGVMNKNYPTGYGYWSFANRISYLLNFFGPSLAVDTACSSSLTAVHLAIDSIQNGTSECAIAGGVNLIINPIHMINLSMMQMLSSSNQCKAFGDQADGFVDGEGVGAIVLKKLSKAIADGDHIYGIIKGSMINSGGKTNGYTVPNPNAQAQVIKEAMQKSGISSRTISYLEAHGTGTALGDPIEITGLTKAFEEDTKDHQFCAIGSLKSNIGHCESAAGIAGITKVLLQFKYRQFAPSLNSQVLNPHIDFAKTPFFVQRESGEWKRPIIDGNEIPRRAGISSFGAGGANAHLIIEEYIPNESSYDQSDLLMIVLSAKNKEALQKRAWLLLQAIQEQGYSEGDLVKIAYTLQIGREAMEERLGLCVGSIKELEEKLRNYLKSDEVEGILQENIKNHKSTLAIFTKDEDMGTIIDLWIEKGKIRKLLELWVKGLNFDWNKLYRSQKPQKISLPTYPFARERYWLDPIQHVPIVKKEGEIMTFEESWIPQEIGAGHKIKLKTIVCFLSGKENQIECLKVLQAIEPKIKVAFIAQGQSYNSLREHGQIDAIFYLWPMEDQKCIFDYSPIINILKSINESELHPSYLLLSGKYSNGLERCYLESWIGFERSLKFALPNTKILGVYGNGNTSFGNWLPILWKELQANPTTTVLYQENQRFISAIHPQKIHPGKNILRVKGTYLITGGLGGLGFLFAKHFAEKYQARLILIGRTSLDEKKQRQIDTLQELGGEVLYLQADVSNRNEMQNALSKAKKSFGAIHGIVHSAGVVAPISLFEKELKEFETILQPKIQGTILLDELLQQEALDFTCYFSSSAAILGDFGSCDYAIGNRFQMAYAEDRKERGSLGKTVVINWPVWKEGGMKIEDDEITEKYLRSTGQRFLETEEGIYLFEQILAQEKTQYLILVGDSAKVISLLPHSETSAHPIEAGSLDQFLERDMKELLQKMMKIPEEKLDLDTNWIEFGLNSINLSEFANILTKKYGVKIPMTLFFKCVNLAEIIQYYLKEHKENIEQFYQKKDPLGTLIEKDSDLQLIELMEKFTRGELEFDVVQSILEKR